MFCARRCVPGLPFTPLGTLVFAAVALISVATAKFPLTAAAGPPAIRSGRLLRVLACPFSGAPLLCFFCASFGTHVAQPWAAGKSNKLLGLY